MNWLELLQQILQVCVIPLLGVLTTYAVKYLNSKSEEIQDKIDNQLADKYIQMLTDTITACVIATNQTYVDNLKKDNAFTKEAQEEAFRLTYKAVMSVLTDEAKKYLTAIYGDLNAYISKRIEAEVSIAKN